MDSWSGASATATSLVNVLAGGHTSYDGNEAYEFNFNTAAPTWERHTNPSTNIRRGVPYYPDGKPATRHKQGMECYIPPLAGSSNGNRVFMPFGWSLAGTGNEHTNVAASYEVTARAYDPQGFFPNFPRSPGAGGFWYTALVAWDPVTEKCWIDCGYPNILYSFDPRTKTYTQYADGGLVLDGTAPDSYPSQFVDPVRRVLVYWTGANIVLRDLMYPATARSVKRPVSGAPTGRTGCGFQYDPVTTNWYLWAGGKTLYVITPPANYRTGDGSPSNPLNASANYSVTQTITPSGGATPGPLNQQGTFGRFNYIAKPRGFCVVTSRSTPMYFFKLPA